MKKLTIYKKRLKNAFGLREELDITQITDNLYVSAWPRARHVKELEKRNIELIVSMIFQKDDKEMGEPPFRLLSYTTFDTPLTPIKQSIYEEVVREAKETHDRGKSVLVHCKSGVNRSVAIASAILVSKGYTADEALELIREKRQVAKADSDTITKPLYEFEKQYNKLNHDNESE